MRALVGGWRFKSERWVGKGSSGRGPENARWVAISRSPGSIPMNAAFSSSATLEGVSGSIARSPIKMLARILHAANLSVPDLAKGRRIEAAALRSAMETACGGSDAEAPEFGVTPIRPVKRYRSCSYEIRLLHAPPGHKAGDASGDAGACWLPFSHADAPVRSQPCLSTILDADRVRLRCVVRCRYRGGRPRARAVGRYRPACDLRGIHRRIICLELAHRNACRVAR